MKSVYKNFYVFSLVFTCRLVGTIYNKVGSTIIDNHGIQNAQQRRARLTIFSQVLPSLCAMCIRRFPNRPWAICGRASGPSDDTTNLI